MHSHSSLHIHFQFKFNGKTGGSFSHILVTTKRQVVLVSAACFFASRRSCSSLHFLLQKSLLLTSWCCSGKMQNLIRVVSSIHHFLHTIKRHYQIIGSSWLDSQIPNIRIRRSPKVGPTFNISRKASMNTFVVFHKRCT